MKRPELSNSQTAPPRVFLNSQRGENAMNDPVESRPIGAMGLRRPAEEYDDPCRPLDRGAAWILLAIGFALGAFWVGFGWAIWSICS
jgi:hypothetical protein